ncbi:MAG: Crp/Fnr family transcriptional regulator [Pseudomonadota bacterium]
MIADDVADRLAPWLARWSLSGGAAADVWLGRLALYRFESEQHLLESGEFSDTLYLLDKGLVRLYYLTPEGRERNKAFYRAGDVTGPLSAALTGSPAPFSIQALEPVEAIGFRFADLHEAAAKDTAVARLYSEALAQAFIRNEQREAVLLTLSAEQRYRWLLDHEPDLPQRVAQYHLASYLGIDPVSLSRLKGKLSC